jgi:hypothetical protein
MRSGARALALDDCHLYLAKQKTSNVHAFPCDFGQCVMWSYALGRDLGLSRGW